MTDRTCLKCGGPGAIKHTIIPGWDEGRPISNHFNEHIDEWWCEPCTYRAMGVPTALLVDSTFTAWESYLKVIGKGL